MTGGARGRAPDASSTAPAGLLPRTACAPPTLAREVGVVGLAASIVNIIVGGGIYRLPAAVAASIGPRAPIAFVVCAAVMGLIVACFAEAGRRVDLTGGPYAYIETAFGRFTGFLAGILVWLVGTLAPAAVATVLADAVGALVPSVTAPPGRWAFLVLTFGVLAAINVRGVRQGTRLNAGLAAAKLLPLLMLILFGVAMVRPANLAWGGSAAGGSLARACALLIFAYCGVESALLPSGEIRDVRRTVPRAVLAAMIIVTLLYLGLQVVAQGVLGASLGEQATPLAAAAVRVQGPWGGRLLLAGAAVSMFGNVSGMALATPRALYALASDGILPAPLGRVHPRFRTPHVAIAAQAALTCALAVTSGFERLAILANLSTLLLYIGCCLAAPVLGRRDSGGTKGPTRLAGGLVVPALACGSILWLLTSITWPEWRIAGGVLGVAGLSYLLIPGLRARPSPASAG